MKKVLLMVAASVASACGTAPTDATSESDSDSIDEALISGDIMRCDDGIGRTSLRLYATDTYFANGKRKTLMDVRVEGRVYTALEVDWAKQLGGSKFLLAVVPADSSMRVPQVGVRMNDGETSVALSLTLDTSGVVYTTLSNCYPAGFTAADSKKLTGASSSNRYPNWISGPPTSRPPSTICAPASAYCRRVYFGDGSSGLGYSIVSYSGSYPPSSDKLVYAGPTHVGRCTIAGSGYEAPTFYDCELPDALPPTRTVCDDGGGYSTGTPTNCHVEFDLGNIPVKTFSSN